MNIEGLREFYRLAGFRMARTSTADYLVPGNRIYHGSLSVQCRSQHPMRSPRSATIPAFSVSRSSMIADWASPAASGRNATVHTVCGRCSGSSASA
jgi:hypothetical protein